MCTRSVLILELHTCVICQENGFAVYKEWIHVRTSHVFEAST